MKLELFSNGVDGVGNVLMKPHVPDIPGLHYFRAFLGDEQQGNVIRQIDESTWLTDLERRVQHYGWRYDYRARTIDRSMQIGPLPDWLAEIAALLHERTGKFDSVPNQANPIARIFPFLRFLPKPAIPSPTAGMGPMRS